MNATEQAFVSEITNPNTPVETLRLWLNVEQEANRLADASMRKAQGLKDVSTRHIRRIKNALRARGEHVE